MKYKIGYHGLREYDVEPRTKEEIAIDIEGLFGVLSLEQEHGRDTDETWAKIDKLNAKYAELNKGIFYFN